MEQRLGHDFGNVRVHSDAQAAESAQALGAKAYTVGRHVVFDAARYAPQTAEGQRLMAHELAHVAQQQGQSERGANGIGPASGAAEAEAHTAADRAMRGEPVFLGRHEMAIAREPENGGDEPADRFADPRLETYRVDAKGKVIGFNIDRLSMQVAGALERSKDARILVLGIAAPGEAALAALDAAVFNVRGALVQWIGKTRFPNLESRIGHYAGFGAEPGADQGTIEVRVQGGGLATGPSVVPPLAVPPGLKPSFAAPAPGVAPPAPAAPKGPSLGDMLTLKFKGGPVEFEISLPKSAKAKLPVRLGSARTLSIELSAEASGNFGFAIWLDGTIPAVRVGLKAGVAVEKDKPVMGSAGLVIETNAKTCTAESPEALKTKVREAGKKLTDAYDAFLAAKEGEQRTEKLIDMASAIGEMYDAVDKASAKCEAKPRLTIEFGGKYPLTEPPVVEPDPLKRPAPYIGITGTWHF